MKTTTHAGREPENPLATRQLWWLVPALALALGSPAPAQLEVSWWTVDGGGGTSSGGGFEVTGTAGQPDAGGASGGMFELEGGFWYADHPAVPVELQQFEIVQSSSEPAGVGSPGYRVEARVCRMDAEPAPEAESPPNAPPAEERSGASSGTLGV